MNPTNLNIRIKIAEEKGIKKGEHKKAIKIAINMLKKQAEIDLIMEFTELSKQEINELKSKI